MSTRSRILLSILLTCILVPTFGFADSHLGQVASKYDVTLYGRVKVDVNFDSAEFRKYNDFLGAVGTGPDNGNNSVNFNPRDTRIGFKVKSKGDGNWVSEARVETDFYGDNNGNNLIPRMRLGYVKATNTDGDYSFLLGQDWIPVAALNPPTIDFGVMSAAGNLWWRVPQLTFRKNFGDNQLMLSLMKHRRISTAEEGRMPWLLARLAHNMECGSIALGGGYRQEDVMASDGQEDEIGSWLAALEIKAKVGSVTIVAEPWIGEGLDKEFLRYDLGINPRDGVGDTALPEAIRAWGGFIAATVPVNEKLKLSLGWGMDDPEDDDLAGITLNDRQFTMNNYVFGNLWYSLTNAIKVGTEVIWIDTERHDTDDDGVRATFSSIYAF